MEQIYFSCKVTNDSESDDLALEFWLDDNQFFDNKIAPGVHTIKFNFDEDENKHRLKIVFKNKTSSHTKVDNQGQILDDVVLSVNDITIDGINIDQIFFENSVYIHNFNETGSTVNEKFYGTLGCNGYIELEFTTPFYQWLLENM